MAIAAFFAGFVMGALTLVGYACVVVGADSERGLN